MTIHSTVYVDNDSMLRVEALRDRDGNLVTDATVTLESLTNKSGTAVSGVTTPSTLTNTGDGNYEIMVSSSAGFSAGKIYEATVKAVTVGGLVGEWVETLVAKRRAA